MKSRGFGVGGRFCISSHALSSAANVSFGLELLLASASNFSMRTSILDTIVQCFSIALRSVYAWSIRGYLFRR
jgi:hypothetical protein